MLHDKNNIGIRFTITTENHKERFSYLKTFLEKTGIRRVLLFTGTGMEELTIKPIEEYKKHARILSEYIPILKKMGVTVDINVLTTMRHIYYAKANQEECGFKRAVDIYGNPSNGSICLKDKGFYGYVKQLYTVYAQLKPNTIFLDDDIRYIKMV